MQHLTRAQDGSFRSGTRRPIAQALLTPICLDNALFADVPAVPGREEPVLADERRETQGWIDMLELVHEFSHQLLDLNRHMRLHVRSAGRPKCGRSSQVS